MIFDDNGIDPDPERTDTDDEDNDQTKRNDNPKPETVDGGGFESPTDDESKGFESPRDEESTGVEPRLEDSVGMNGFLGGWENHKLLLTLALAQGIAESGISDENLCQTFQSETTVQKKRPIPLIGMLRKVDDYFAIKLEDNQTRSIQFGDKLVNPTDQEKEFGIVSSVEKLGSIFKVQLHNQNTEISFEDAQKVAIFPFSIGNISKVCKTTPRPKLIEDWMAHLSARPDLSASENKIWQESKEHNLVTKLFKLARPSESEEEGQGFETFQEKNEQASFNELMETVRDSLKQIEEARTKDCPTSLTDGKCIDTTFVKKAGRDQDIRSYELFSSDIRVLVQELTTHVGEQEAQQLCRNFNPFQAVYEEVMHKNATLWAQFAKHNRAVQETLHYLLVELITFCVEEIPIKDTTKKLQRAAVLWLQFYIAMPSFFYAMSLYLWTKFKDIDQGSLKENIPFIIDAFYNLLKTNLNGVFLPKTTIIHQQVNEKFESLRQTLRRFKFLPQVTIKTV